MKKYVHPEMEIDVFGVNDGIIVTRTGDGDVGGEMPSFLLPICVTDLGVFSICTSDGADDSGIDPIDSGESGESGDSTTVYSATFTR